jgi:hypothetical protein
MPTVSWSRSAGTVVVVVGTVVVVVGTVVVVVGTVVVVVDVVVVVVGTVVVVVVVVVIGMHELAEVAPAALFVEPSGQAVGAVAPVVST